MSLAKSIPNRTIQTAPTRKLAPIEQASRVNIKLLHPEWDHQFYDDNDIRQFLHQEFPEYVPAFTSFRRNIQRIDFFRYLAIYKFGGFYFDLDVFLNKDISNLCASECVFPFEELTINDYLRNSLNIDWEIGNYAFGSTPGHPFLAKVIENCLRSLNNPDWVKPMMNGIPKVFRSEFEVLNTTGPGMLTRTFAENQELARTVKVLFPTDVRDQSTWHHFGEYGIHQMAATWRDRGNLIHRKLKLIWEMRKRRTQFGDSNTRGSKRSY